MCAAKSLSGIAEAIKNSNLENKEDKLQSHS